MKTHSAIPSDCPLVQDVPTAGSRRSRFGRREYLRVALIAVLVASTTVLHYRTDQLLITSHILFRELYFLPIILAGFWFGTKGALTVSLAITFLYLPYVLSLPEGISGHNFGNLVQILLFNTIGLFIGLLRDRETEQQRKTREAENLAAMGRAVSCIAHDMKTPLMAIGGFVRQVRRKVPEEHLAAKLDVASAQVERLEALVGDMLAFARPLQLQCRQGTINELVEESVMLAGEKAAQHHSVSIATDLQDDMPAIRFDQCRLQQALINLINNALEASPPGEEILVRGSSDGQNIIIEVSDRGTGILREHQDDIFKPFMTTKKGGTGLGLPIVKKVIEAHDGTIDLKNNSDKGVTFRITLPVTPVR